MHDPRDLSPITSDNLPRGRGGRTIHLAGGSSAGADYELTDKSTGRFVGNAGMGRDHGSSDAGYGFRISLVDGTQLIRFNLAWGEVQIY